MKSPESPQSSLSPQSDRSDPAVPAADGMRACARTRTTATAGAGCSDSSATFRRARLSCNFRAGTVVTKCGRPYAARHTPAGTIRAATNWFSLAHSSMRPYAFAYKFSLTLPSPRARSPHARHKLHDRHLLTPARALAHPHRPARPLTPPPHARPPVR